MVLIGCFGYIHGLYQLFSGQLLVGRGNHPWLKGFLEVFLGNYAFVGAALVSMLIGAAFIYMGVKGLTYHSSGTPNGVP